MKGAGMKITVFGGTGLVGGAVADALMAAEHDVRIVSRDVERARRRFGPSAGVAEADAEEGPGLEEAVQGCQGIVLSISGPREGASIGRIMEVAGSVGGFEQVLLVSGCTVTEENRWFPMIREKLAAEAHVRDSGIPWTILAPGWFFETLQRFVRNGRATLIGSDPNQYHFVAAADFGQIAARAFHLPEGRNRRFVVHGPEGITLKEALTRYCRLRHPEITKVGQPPTWFLRLMARLTRNEMLGYALDLMGYFKKVGELGDPSETNALFGAPSTTLEVWARGKE
jgi:uncharacterized protein YbjT (DUF2867 family)